MVDTNLTQQKIDLGTGPLGVSGTEITRQARALPSAETTALDPVVDIRAMSDDEVIQRYFSVGDTVEDLAVREIVNNADIFMTPLDDDGNVIEGARRENNFIDPNRAAIATFKNPQDKYRTLLEQDGVPGVRVSSQYAGERGVIDVQDEQGNTVHYRFHTMPYQEQYREAAGYTVDMYGEPVEPEPLQNSFTSWGYTLDRQDKVDEFSEKLADINIPLYARTALAERYVDESLLRARQGASLPDFGKMVLNLGIGVYNAGVERFTEDIPATAFAAMELTNEMLEDGATYSVLVQGASDLLQAAIIENPDEQDKVSGNGKLKMEYFDYASDILANNMGITPQQADTILNGAQADVVDKFFTIAIETAPFAIAEGLYMTARGVQLFNKGFKPYVAGRFFASGATNYEEAVEIAAKQGFGLEKLALDFATDKAMSTPFFRRFSFTRDLMKMRIQDLIGVGSVLSTTSRAASYKAARELNDKFTQEAAQQLDAGQYGKAAASILKAEKVLIAAAVPKQIVDLAGDETWAAFGAANASYYFQENFGQDWAPLGEMSGALVGVTMMPVLGGKFIDLTVDTVSGATSALKFLAGDDKKSIKALKAAATRPGASRELKMAYDLIYKGTSREYQESIEAKLMEMGALETRLMGMTDAEGNPIFKEGDIINLFGDVTGLQILQDMTDYIDGRMSTMDVVAGGEAILEKKNVLQMRRLMAQRIAESLNKLRPIQRELQDAGDENSAQIIQGMSDYVETLNRQLDEDVAAANDQITQINGAIDSLIQFGEVPAMGVTVLNATEVIENRQRAILIDFTGEDGTLTDVDGALAALEAEASRLRTEMGESSKMGAELKALSNREGQGKRLHNHSQQLFALARAKRDALYEAFGETAPDSRVDIFGIYDEIFEAGGMSHLDQGLDLGNVIPIDEATKAAMKLGGLETGQLNSWRRMFNANAIDFFREHPQISSRLNLSPDSTLEQVAEASQEFAEEIHKAVGGELGPAPIDHLAYLRGVFKRAATDEAYLEKVSEAVGGLDQEAAATIAKSFILPASPRQFKYMMQGLTPLRAEDPKSVARIALRKNAMDLAEDPETGFKNNIYSPDAESVGDEVIGKLREANGFNREFRERYNPATKAGKIVRSSTKTPLKPVNSLDEILKPINKALKSDDIRGNMDEDIGSELARLAGGHYDPATDRFYILEGSEAEQQIKNTLKAHINRVWMLSGPGRELVNRAERGKLPVGTVLSREGVEVLQNLQTMAGPKEFIADSDLPAYITAIQQIPVYKLDENGKVITDINQAGELMSSRDVVEAVDIENWAGLSLKKGERISLYGDHVRTASDMQRVAIEKARSEVKRQERELREEITRGLGRIVGKGQDAVGPGTRLTLYETMTNDVGLRRIIEYREALRAEKGDEAVEFFNREMADTLAHQLAMDVKTSGNDVDINKLEKLMDSPGFFAALNEFGGEQAVQNYRDLIALARRTLDRPKSSRFIGTPQPYGIDAELNKVWAVSQGRGSLRWFTLQLLVRQGRQMNLQSFRAMLSDPELGRELIQMIRDGKQPSGDRTRRAVDAFLTYSARDIVLYGEEGVYGRTFGPPARKAYNKILQRDIKAEDEVVRQVGSSVFEPTTKANLKYGVTSYRREMDTTNRQREGMQ